MLGLRRLNAVFFSVRLECFTDSGLHLDWPKQLRGHEPSQLACAMMSAVLLFAPADAAARTADGHPPQVSRWLARFGCAVLQQRSRQETWPSGPSTAARRSARTYPNFSCRVLFANAGEAEMPAAGPPGPTPGEASQAPKEAHTSQEAAQDVASTGSPSQAKVRRVAERSASFALSMLGGRSGFSAYKPSKT